MPVNSQLSDIHHLQIRKILLGGFSKKKAIKLGKPPCPGDSVRFMKGQWWNEEECSENRHISYVVGERQGCVTQDSCPPGACSPVGCHSHLVFLESKKNVPQRTWHFSKGKEIANNHIKRCSMSSVIRKMQTKTTTKYHITPTRMAIVKKKKKERKKENGQCWRCGEGNSPSLPMEM